MKQLISYYRMPDDREEEIARLIHAKGLDGVENLIYGSQAGNPPFSKITVGTHLRYWPYWMDFYEGKNDRLCEIFANQEKIRQMYGAEDREGWIQVIRANICAALAEKPRYLVWHVQESTPEEAFSWRFRHTDEEVLTATAELYQSFRDLIPDGVFILFENIFWPGLYRLEPEKVEYFFTRLDDPAHAGLMFDSGHFMITNPDLTSEKEAALYIRESMKQLGEMKSLVKGIHLSCSLSGAYIRQFRRGMTVTLTDQVMMRHICSLDHHDPFQTRAAREIVEAIEPDYVTHELFGNTFAEAMEKARKQALLVTGETQVYHSV